MFRSKITLKEYLKSVQHEDAAGEVFVAKYGTSQLENSKVSWGEGSRFQVFLEMYVC